MEEDLFILMQNRGLEIQIERYMESRKRDTTNSSFGYLTKDAMVLMADESEKPIAEVIEGDKVLWIDGGEKKVSRVNEEEAEKFFRITLANGKSVAGIDVQQILTEDGYISMKDIVKEDLVWLLPATYYKGKRVWNAPNNLAYGDDIKSKKSNFSRVKQIEVIEEKTKVYSIELELNHHGIFCNGIIVGDHLMPFSPIFLRKEDKFRNIRKRITERTDLKP